MKQIDCPTCGGDGDCPWAHGNCPECNGWGSVVEDEEPEREEDA